MEIYLAGTPVTLAIPLVDRYGNPLDASSISYRVVDQDGNEVVSSTPLTSFVPSSPATSVLIAASLNQIVPVPASINNNQIDMYNPRGSRTVELTLVLNGSGNTIQIAKSYALEPQDPLVVGINSFMTLSESDLVSLDVPNLTAWDTSTEHEKIAALVDARDHICQLNFWMLNSNINWGQDSLNYIPDGSYESPYAASGSQLFMFNGNLALLTPQQFLSLPIRFRAVLRKAQLVEADAILGGDPVEARRREGMILETIGESKQMYRNVKALEMPVCKRALRYLSQFVTFSKRIGRG